MSDSSPVLHPILHIVSAQIWADHKAGATGDYADPSLDTEGFIHCSTAAQVLIPANERFAGQDDLLLLVIDPAMVTASVVYEDCYESGMAFPHIYGPINTSAVIDEVAFPCRPDGGFDLPAELSPTPDQS